MVVAFSLVLGVPAFLFCLVWALGSDVVALGLLSPFLIKMWGLAVAVVVSPSSRVFGDGLAVELFGTISGNVNGEEGNAPETHGTRNGTHGDVGKIDMCVLNPAPWNLGRKWGRGGCFNWYQSQAPSTEQGRNASVDSSNISKVKTEGDMEAGKKERARHGVALRFGKMTLDRNDAAQDGLLAPKEVRIDREVLGPFRMEDSVPTRKRARPRKIPSIEADRLRSVTGVCRCEKLMQANQGTHSVWEYIEEFLETTKRCKPKSAEDWCRGIKAGLREEIQSKLLGIAGQAVEAERALTIRVVAISSSKEEVEVEEDLRKRLIMDERTSGECTEPC
ncbi:unnamed protein product, partial [Brassica rapa subsp. narinosa]